MVHLSVTILCLATLFHTGMSLQCYNCVTRGGEKNCDEMSDKSKVAVATCGQIASNQFVPGCIKKVIEDKTTKVINTTRACIITKKDGDIVECKPSSDRSNVMSCDVCYDDLCNSSVRIAKQHFLLFAPLILGLLAKYLHY